ncbi:MAG: RNA methyltransferase [Cyanobacteria bacterium P01_F01_bin.53]
MVENASASTDLSSVRIVLVAPAGPLNIGSVARVMKNFGLSQLVLVTPQCDPLSEEALKMAVHAKDLLHTAKQVNTIPEALDGCSRAVATTARQRGFEAPLGLPEIILPSLLPTGPAASNSEASYGDTGIAAEDQEQTALIFGPEDRGLSNEELIYAQHFTKIPTHPGYSALNLAQAVAVCCYELYRASTSATPIAPLTIAQKTDDDFSQAKNVPSQVKKDTVPSLLTTPLSGKQTESDTQIHLSSGPAAQAKPNQAKASQAKTNLAKLNELEGYYQHLEAVLLKVEYLYPHTAASRMRKFRQLLHRASPTTNEIALLRGILRQVEWAISNPALSDSALSDAQKDER